MKTGKDNHSVKLSTKDVINLKEMDYKEKYEQALERAREQYNKRTPLYDIESIFPELQEKESEDERMKKAIMHVLYENYSDAAVIEGVEIAEIAAWLEKQGEKVTDINGEDYGIDGLYHAIRILEKTVGKVTGYQSDDGILEHKAAINAVKELYKKQGEKKPTDKVEPKTLDADKVIAWLVANICDFEHYVKLFKKDFGL